MMLKSISKNQKTYDTWPDFKKDLELNLWCHLESSLWLKIKPKKALPWYGSDMQVALSRILKY